MKLLYKALPDRARSALSSCLTTTGTMISPRVLLTWSARRIALPTACTMSILDRRGSTNITPSSVGMSTPSVRQRALVIIRLF